MDTSVFRTPRTRLFEATVGRLEDWLAAEGYVGSTDLDCMLNGNGVYPLEFADSG